MASMDKDRGLCKVQQAWSFDKMHSSYSVSRNLDRSAGQSNTRRPGTLNLTSVPPSKPFRYGPVSGVSMSQPKGAEVSTNDGINRHAHGSVVTVQPTGMRVSSVGGIRGLSELRYEPDRSRDPRMRSNVNVFDNSLLLDKGRVGENIGYTSSKSAHCLTESLPENLFCLSCPPVEFKFSDAYRAKTLPRTGKEDERLIGFATLPEQVHRKSVKKGFDFTLMTMGDSGLGKSTLISSLFYADFYNNRKLPQIHEKIASTTVLKKNTVDIEERGVKLRLTVVDTPGFGDALNCDGGWKPCIDYIDEQFRQYFEAESGLNRKHIQDTRVHCCLYFIPPYGPGLRPIDIEALKCLQSRVNIIPLIAKADALTPGEVKRLKEQIIEDLKQNKITIYQFPECDEDENEEFKRQHAELKASVPFAVSSSNTFVEIGGKKIRGRQYPWGIVEVENPLHSDFSKLKTMLIQSHMHDLKETTEEFHYENFRVVAISDISKGNHPKERRFSKPECCSESPEDLIQEKEAEIHRMQEIISKMEAKLMAAGKIRSYDS